MVRCINKHSQLTAFGNLQSAPKLNIAIKGEEFYFIFASLVLWLTNEMSPHLYDN